MAGLSRKLGCRIKEIRRARGLTQERLAEQADLSPRYLSRLEVGQQSPSIEMLTRLARALNVEMWELFDFGHVGTMKELQETLSKLIRELDEEKLRLVVKVIRAFVR
jgi:transcriptional regulator with XRE-family HTH domain